MALATQSPRLCVHPALQPQRPTGRQEGEELDPEWAQLIAQERNMGITEPARSREPSEPMTVSCGPSEER